MFCWEPEEHYQYSKMFCWEPEGHCQYSKMFCWEPEEHYRHRLCNVIAPFWFSTEHLWILIVPFWFSTEHLWILIVPFWFSTEHLWILIVPFWFSTEHLWILIVPFWLSTDTAIKGGQLFGPYFQPRSTHTLTVTHLFKNGGVQKGKNQRRKQHCSSGINMCIDSPLPLRTPIFLFLFEWGWSKLKTIACKNQVHIGSRGGIDARTEVEFH